MKPQLRLTSRSVGHAEVGNHLGPFRSPAEPNQGLDVGFKQAFRVEGMAGPENTVYESQVTPSRCDHGSQPRGLPDFGVRDGLFRAETVIGSVQEEQWTPDR